MIKIENLDEFREDLSRVIHKYGIDGQMGEFSINIAGDIIVFLKSRDSEERKCDADRMDCRAVLYY